MLSSVYLLSPNITISIQASLDIRKKVDHWVSLYSYRRLRLKYDLQPNDAPLEGLCHRFSAVIDSQFLKDVAYMGLDRAFRD